MKRFAQVDVFTSGPFTGNPLAVVVDADGLTDGEMRAFASWTNLSETTFLLPATDPAADYRVRIFTPAGELPFAGHPTLGSCHAWLEAGGTPTRADRIVQQCALGLVPVRRDGDRLAFAAPDCYRTGPLEDDALDRALRCLGLGADDVVAHTWGVNGPNWAIVQLASADAVRALRPDVTALVGHRLGDIELGVVGFEPEGSEFAYEVRAFVPPPSPAEDPVTGSLNAVVAQWLRSRGLVGESYRATQGSQLGRAGDVAITDDGADIWVGGRVRTHLRGEFRL